MLPARALILTLLSMAAFAGNSLLCRLALRQTDIDAASFTAIRLISGALVLWLAVHSRRGTRPGVGNWLSALALFSYAACFSFAYVSLPTGTGALLLFGAVQALMIGYGIWSGERLRPLQIAGLALAFGGLAVLLLPGVSAPPLAGTVLMLAAGVSWGIYSLRGKGAGDPTQVTAGNFLRAVPLAIGLGAIMLAANRMSVDAVGIGYAVASGGLTSGIGYAVWYSVVPALKSTTAASVQLSVPVLAAVGGIAFLGETLTLRLVLASIAILGGIALVALQKRAVPGRTGVPAPATVKNGTLKSPGD